MRKETNLKKILMEKNITVAELARSVGATRQYINAACNGDCPLSENWAKRIAGHLQVDMNEFYAAPSNENGYVEYIVTDGADLKFSNINGVINFVNQFIGIGYIPTNSNYIFGLSEVIQKFKRNVAYLPVKLTLTSGRVYIDFYKNATEAKNSENVILTITLEKIKKEDDYE